MFHINPTGHLYGRPGPENCFFCELHKSIWPQTSINITLDKHSTHISSSGFKKIKMKSKSSAICTKTDIPPHQRQINVPGNYFGENCHIYADKFQCSECLWVGPAPHSRGTFLGMRPEGVCVTEMKE